MRRESKRNRVYHGGSVNANRGRGCSIGTARYKYAPAAIARAAITARIPECIVLYRRDRRTRQVGTPKNNELAAQAELESIMWLVNSGIRS